MVYHAVIISFLNVGTRVFSVGIFTAIDENCKEMVLEFSDWRLSVFVVLPNLSSRGDWRRVLSLIWNYFAFDLEITDKMRERDENVVLNELAFTVKMN